MIGMIDLNMKFIGFIYVLMLKMKIILQSIDDNHLKVCSIASSSLKYCLSIVALEAASFVYPLSL